VNPLTPFFSQVPVLSVLPDDTQKRLERTAEQRQYRRRQVVHFADQAGDFVYLLCNGRVKISRVSDQGREVTLYLLENTALFGETGLANENQPYELMAETLEDSLIAVFRRAEIVSALKDSPRAATEMMKLLSERRSQAESAVADLVFMDVPRRLAKLLLKLHDSQGGKNGSRVATVLKTKFTHQELANMIGSTRETTTLVLNDFKRQGIIDFMGRKIIVRSRAELEDVLRGVQKVVE
jgi:CRP/FNR family cyclic AMP-dependent transcriptional regulator